MTEQEKHILHYSLLALGLSVLSVFFVLFRFDTRAQLIMAALGSLYYVLWGIIHHALEKRLNRLTIFEYILFGALVFLLIFSVLSL
jgi:hypothetical protein